VALSRAHGYGGGALRVVVMLVRERVRLYDVSVYAETEWRLFVCLVLGWLCWVYWLRAR
jgi:hypothetical protein